MAFKGEKKDSHGKRLSGKRKGWGKRGLLGSVGFLIEAPTTNPAIPAGNCCSRKTKSLTSL